MTDTRTGRDALLAHFRNLDPLIWIISPEKTRVFQEVFTMVREEFVKNKPVIIHMNSLGVPKIIDEPVDFSVLRLNTEDAMRLWVSDSGEGILPEDVSRIFDRFWRGDPARSHSGGAGMGLGLAIAKGLVEAHGGRIWADSTQGQGTTISCVLPLPSTVKIAQ